MIVDWIAQAPIFALAALVMFGPGLLLGALLRLRGLALFAAAPGITAGLLAVLAILFPKIGLGWNLLSATAGVALAAVLVWIATLLISRGRWSAVRHPMPRRSLGILIGGLVVGSALNAARLLSYIGLPAAISQTNDAVFHLNALRWIAENGSASSLELTGLIGHATFYPAAWHAVASLVVLDVSQIPIAVNMLSLVIAAIVWPLSIAFLAKVISGNTIVAALAAALSAGLMAFPQLMFEWGVLYPYALSLAILPATVALTIMALRSFAGVRGRERLRGSAGFAAASILGVIGIALAQPSTLLIWALLVLLWVTSVVLTRSRRWEKRWRLTNIGLLAAAWAILVVVWVVLAYLAGPVLWAPYLSPLRAGVDVVLNSHSQLPAAVVMSLLMIAGIIVAIRSVRWRWFAIAWALVSVLYIVSVATDLPIVKRALTGPWYGDSFRLAAIVPVLVIPLTAIGLWAALTWISKRWNLRLVVIGVIAMVAITILTIVEIAIAPVVPLRVAAETDAGSRYSLHDESHLSSDEVALISQLPELVPEDAVLIANPSTGAAFTYALGGRDIVPRTWSPPQSEAWDTIAADLRDAGTNPAVCPALAAYGQPDYVLDFGPGEAGPGLYVMPGMTNFEGQPGFEEVASVGDASLWKITACN